MSFKYFVIIVYRKWGDIMFLVTGDIDNDKGTEKSKLTRLQEEFRTVYPFTTENIAGYMEDLDLNNKRIITVTGSTDHIINAIARGATDITTFDINPLAKYYMDLRLAAIKALSYHDYKGTFLYRELNLKPGQVKRLDMPDESKDFWLTKLAQCNNDWLAVRKLSSLFNSEIIDLKMVQKCNLYFDEYVYEEIRKKLSDVSINFIQTNLADINLDKQYDYMFLSNISDYADCMYKRNRREEYANLIKRFQEYVQNIYFAYLYTITKTDLEGYENDLDVYKRILGDFQMLLFDNSSSSDSSEYKDGVLVLTRK